MCFSSKKYKALQSQAQAQDPNAPRSYVSTEQGTPIATTMAPMQLVDPNKKGFAALAAMSQQPGGLRMAGGGFPGNAAQPVANAASKMMGASRVIS